MRPFLVFLISIAAAVSAVASIEEQVNYFPSVLYGHILAGAAASRYETTFILRATKSTRAHIEVFSESGEPMRAGFADEEGVVAATGESFTFIVQPAKPLRIKIQLPMEEAGSEIAVKTGWATVSSAEELEASVLVRTTTADGKVLTRHVLASERPTRS